MKNLLHPRWLLLFSTLPVVLLFAIFGSQYSVIKTLLSDVNLYYWMKFSWSLAGLGVLNLLYLMYATIKGRKISLLFSIINLVLHIAFIYAYLNNTDKIIPFSIPMWMIPENMEIFALAFLMPVMGYSLLTMVVILTPEEANHKAWVNFLVAIAIPLSGYLIAVVIIPILNGFSFNTNFAIVTIIIATITFLFFLCRGFYIVAINKSESWKKYALVWKIPFTLLLPIIGLLVNNGFITDKYTISNNGIFGNFSSMWFYILAAINGLALCIPDANKKYLRLFLFIIRSITFAYTFYFFMVFLPFLPLSLMAVIAIGLGFLMLTPIILLVIHANQLSNDFSFLQQFIATGKLRIIGFLSFLLLPVLLTLDYHNDKVVLYNALDYVYQPDYQKHYDIDTIALRKSMDVLIKQKNGRGDWIFVKSTPYLSTYYNWLVLDNLTISDTKINKLQKVFFNSTEIDYTMSDVKNEDVVISNADVHSRYDTNKACWISTVDFAISNQDKNALRSQEYSTVFELPVGCWISDYYLTIDGKKEKGILAEKKSAQWIYNNIVNERKDPGILYYLNGNKIMFRVFPVAPNETRKTGIEFMHKEPLTLTIDGRTLQLGDSAAVINKSSITNNQFGFVTAAEKSTLKKTTRKPYYHFLVDVSNNIGRQKQQVINNISTFINNNYLQPNQVAISFVNTYNQKVSSTQDWQKQLNETKFHGGYFLDRAIRQTLSASYEKNEHSYPVIIAVSPKFKNAILDKDFSDLQFTYPDGDYFFEMGSKGELIPHSLWNQPADSVMTKDSSMFHPHPVLEYSNGKTKQWLSDDGQSSIVLNQPHIAIDNKAIKEKDMNSALLMQAGLMSDVLHPDQQEAHWLDEVKNSFRSKIMMPSTSYLVVETPSQKAALIRKQQQVLSGKKSLDTGEQTTRMSEPEWWVVGVLLILFIGYRERKRKRLSL